MADQKPPVWTRPDGEIGQTPLHIAYDVDPVGDPTKDANALAAKIIRDQQPVINRFVKVQRQEIEIGHYDVHRAMLPLPNMEVFYQYISGLERMHYHVNPEAEEPPKVSEPLPPTELPEIKVEAPTAPPPADPIPGPEPPEPPEPDKPPKTPEPPEPPEAPEPKEPKEKEPEKEYGHPEFMTIMIPYYLAVVFGDGAEDA